MSARPGGPPAPLPLLSAEEMRRWDRRAQEALGIPERVLMESAGRAAARVIHRLYPRGRVAAAVGAGNNGGDALVVLRTLRAWGREVVAVPVGGAGVRAELLHGWALPTAGPAEGEAALRGAAVVVDGILGTGARGAPREPAALLIRAIEAAGRPVAALDGPSGVDLDTGAVAGEAVRAEVTLSFGAAKRGHLLFPGRSRVGRLVVLEVGFPPLEPGEAGAGIPTEAWARERLPEIAPDAHKGRTGTVVVLGGRAGMAGAAVMVAHGALRAGAGLARVVSAAENRVAVQAALPEAIFTERGADGEADALEGADALVAGPGMGTDDASLALLRGALERVPGSLVLDADALTLLAREPGLAGPAAERVLLTPHPGEMGRLLGTDAARVVADPFGAAAEAAARFGCAVLLKGTPAVVAAPGRAPLANVTGHSGVATGGMGDTLAGIAGALLAQGADPYEGGALAVLLAGRAAERAGRGRSLLPRDVAEALGDALRLEPPPPPDPPLDDPAVLLDLPPPR